MYENLILIHLLQAISYGGTLFVFGGVGSSNTPNNKVFALTQNNEWHVVAVAFTDGSSGFPTFSPSITLNPELLHCQ